MRNTDKVTAVGYTTGMTGVRGDFGTKIRFTLGETNSIRLKELAKLGATDIYFVNTPAPMTKAEALVHLQSLKDPKFTSVEVQRAIAHAAKRILPVAKPKKKTK
jgi:hypothetical protein